MQAYSDEKWRAGVAGCGERYRGCDTSKSQLKSNEIK